MELLVFTPTNSDMNDLLEVHALKCMSSLALMNLNLMLTYRKKKCGVLLIVQEEW